MTKETDKDMNNSASTRYLSPVIRENLAITLLVLAAISNIWFFLSQYRILIVNRESIVNIIDPRDISTENEQYSSKIEAAQGIVVEASSFVTGNISRQPNQFGLGIVIDGGIRPATANWHFTPEKGGDYELWAYYASGTPRPIQINFNGKIISKNAMDKITGGFTADHLLWEKLGTVKLNDGRNNTLNLRGEKLIPHIRLFKFIPVGIIEE